MLNQSLKYIFDFVQRCDEPSSFLSCFPFKNSDEDIEQALYMELKRLIVIGKEAEEHLKDLIEYKNDKGGD